MTPEDLIQQMRGRAKFCRDRGEIKTPELLERAINLLESQETERLKTELLAAEAEIARLQSALDELKEWCRFQLCENDGTQWDAGWCASHRRILNEINRITGADK